MKSLLTLFSIACAALMISATNPGTGYNIGDTATDFSLKNIDGKFVSLSDFKNAKGYIVIFTCNTCPYAKMYEDRIIGLHKKFAHKGFPVIAINPNDPSIAAGDSFSKMQERAKEKGFEFPYVFDAGQMVFPQYGATKTPHVYVLDNKRTVKYIGAIDDNPQSAESVELKYVESAVAAIEKGSMPNPSTTKAIGCSIKVKA